MKRPGKRTIIVIFSLVAVLVALGTGLGVLLHKLYHLEEQRGRIINALKTALHREVSYDKAEFSWSFGPVFTVSGIRILEKDGTETFASADRLKFRISIIPLLYKKIVFKEIELDKPGIALSRYPSGLFNISDLLGESGEGLSTDIRDIVVNDGRVSFADNGFRDAAVTTILENINLRASDFRKGSTSHVDLSAHVLQNGGKALISLSGKVGIAGETEPITESSLDARIRIKELSVDPYWPYYRQHVPFRRITGTWETDSHIKGSFGEFSASGSVSAKNLFFHYPGVFDAPLTPQQVTVSYSLRRTPSEVALEEATVAIDGVRINGKFSISDIGTDDPLISASATTSAIQLEKFGGYIPFGIIPDSTAAFIKAHIKGGSYRLLEGSLNGRISKITSMEEKDNSSVLYVRAAVEKGLMTFGAGVPAISAIQGELELKDKNFNLHGMTGRFGDSPLTLEGSMTGYCLDDPFGLPFTMTMKPGRREIAWLLGVKASDRLTVDGENSLHMTGRGTTSDYTLEGNWDLTGASYSFRNLLSKPKRQHNRISFKTLFKGEELHIESFSYDLAPLVLKASGLYHFKDGRLSSLRLETGAFRIEDIAGNLPPLKKFQPRGSVRLSAGGSRTAKGADTRWQGSIAFANASFRPLENSKAVTSLNGSFNLSGDGMESSPLSGTLGSSPLQAKVSLKNFGNPALEISFSSPSLEVEDLGFRAPPSGIRLSDLSGNFTYRDGAIEFRSVEARLNSSKFRISATMPDIGEPYFDIAASASHLDWDDVLLLSRIRPGREGAETPDMYVKASVTCNRGVVRNTPYANLRAELTYQKEELDIKKFSVNAFDGRISGESRIFLPADGNARYRVVFDTEDISAEKLFKAGGAKETLITGLVSMKGKLTAEGATIQDMRATARGAALLKMEKGSINGFTFLSRVFSILNLTNMLKLKLPDLVSEGMPYKTITGNFNLEDGLLTTSDLFVKSDVVNISIVGKTDIVKEVFRETTVGVQPLQTVDKIVSNIPIVGWILTDETKSLVSFYFYVKGKWGDPEVKVMPIQSMADSTFNFFKRIFQLPAKLFTDTGEVIMGR